MFIGFYSFANMITLFGLLSAVTACFHAANGNIKHAIYMLFLACICDMFDGKIARSTPNRTEDEKFYGIQLDSLCDAISFGVAPCFIAYSFGFDSGIDVLIYGIFVICGVTRLAYFNTLAAKNPGKKMKTFRGIPIPMSTFLVTFLFVLTAFIEPDTMVWLFRIGYLALAICFVLNIKVKKPSTKKGMILIAVEIILLLVLLIAGDCKAPENGGAKVDGSSETSENSEEVSDTSIEESSNTSFEISDTTVEESTVNSEADDSFVETSDGTEETSEDAE